MTLTPENLSICGLSIIVIAFVVSQIIAAYGFKEAAVEVEPPVEVPVHAPIPLSSTQLTELFRKNDNEILELVRNVANEDGYLFSKTTFQTIAEESVKQETHEKRMATN